VLQQKMYKNFDVEERQEGNYLHPALTLGEDGLK
jgi:hypothetical protein